MKVRAAVIGLGVGEQHALAYSTHPGSELVALCDTDEERLRAVGQRFPGVHLTTEPGEILRAADVDAVSIASYDDAHYAQIVTGLESGKHLFVEKPLCMRAEEAATIEAMLAERPELVVSSNLILRLSPRFVDLRGRIADGSLGAIYYAEADYEYGRIHKIVDGWRGDLPYYSVVLGGGVHMADLLLWLTNKRVASVSAWGNRIVTAGTKFAFDDFVVAVLRFEDGSLGKITANFGSATPHFHGVKIYGSEATFVNRIGDAELQTRDAVTPVTTEYPGVPKGALIPGFLDAILTGSPPPVTPDDVFRTLDVCFAIVEALETGLTVSVQSRS